MPVLIFRANTNISALFAYSFQIQMLKTSGLIENMCSQPLVLKRRGFEEPLFGTKKLSPTHLMSVEPSVIESSGYCEMQSEICVA